MTNFLPNAAFSARSVREGQQRALEGRRGRSAVLLPQRPALSSSAPSLLPQGPNLTLSQEGLWQVCPPRVLCPGSTVGAVS